MVNHLFFPTNGPWHSEDKGTKKPVRREDPGVQEHPNFTPLNDDNPFARHLLSTTKHIPLNVNPGFC